MDERELAAIAERDRRELQNHCYRMLGSVEDSEDVVQETLLFDRVGGRVDLERIQVVEAPEGVTHPRFRVIR